MDEFKIDDVLEQIYQIDELGIELQEKHNKLEEEHLKNLLDELKKLGKQSMKTTRLEAKKESKEILRKTILDEQAIMEKCYRETNRLDNILRNHKDELIKRVFNHVFLND